MNIPPIDALKNYVGGATAAIESSLSMGPEFALAVELTWDSLCAGGTIYWCGNGGSAADAQHLSAELIGRFELERAPIRSISLTTDTSVLTALANDYEYSEVFARQVRALVLPDDVLIAISTSGNSENVLRAMEAANAVGAGTIALTGRGPSRCGDRADVCINVDSQVTSHIQEAHIVMGHLLCRLLERRWAVQAT